MRERIVRALQYLRSRDDWDRYSVDTHCQQVASVARCTFPAVQAIAQDLGLYAESPAAPLRVQRLRDTHLTSAQAGERLRVHSQHVIYFARAGRLTRYQERTHSFWDPAEVERLAQELAREREQARQAA